MALKPEWKLPETRTGVSAIAHKTSTGWDLYLYDEFKASRVDAIDWPFVEKTASEQDLKAIGFRVVVDR